MSPITEELAAERWAEYFDAFARRSDGLLVTIEVMSEELGDQTDVERLPLQAIGYDPRDNVLEVSVGGRSTRYPVVLRHFIWSPQTISVEGADRSSPRAILVTDASGVRTLIRLFEPAALEA
ncbi:MAG: DUF5335 family protein [Solirubrobacterales bacterium]